MSYKPRERAEGRVYLALSAGERSTYSRNCGLNLRFGKRKPFSDLGESIFNGSLGLWSDEAVNE